MSVSSVYTQLAKKWDVKKDPRLAHTLCKSYKGIPKSKFIYLIGAPDDRGVKNSHGRVGAAQGPACFRKYLGRLVTFEGAEHLCDLGDIPIRKSIQDSHSALSDLVQEVHNSNPDALVIVIGGGHDYGYGEIAGLIGARPEKKIGVCNIDAHLDVRPVKNDVITSGTPFWRLWKDYESHIAYHLTFGVQKSAAAQAHLKYLEERRSKIIFASEVLYRQQQEEVLAKELDVLFSSADRVSMNIDLDAFSLHYVPGVSAPSVFGLVPVGIMNVLTRYVTNPFLKTMGIYELNPAVDYPGDPSSRLAAEMVYQFVIARIRAMADLASKKTPHVV